MTENNETYTIVPLDDDNIEQAKNLVNSVFPHQVPSERMSFPMISWRNRPILSKVSWIFGVKELSNYWLALDCDQKVVAISGHYRMRKDYQEAVWLGWYCVDPAVRGRGLGKLILDRAVEEARKLDVRYLRLYTSDHPIMAVAQTVYDKNGFKTIKEERKVGGFLIGGGKTGLVYYTKIYKELDLRPE